MKKLIFGVAISLLSGCATQQQYSGQGEYFELLNVNLIERDLSVFKPTQVAMTPVIAPPKKIERKKPQKVLPTFVVREGERYQVALKRWVRKQGFSSVAWSMSTIHSQKLDTLNDKKLAFSGSLKKAVNQLSKELDIPIKVTVDKRYKVAGLYDFEDDARITHISGHSLKIVTQRVVENYGLRWEEGTDNKRSWLVNGDYEFGADYYLLTAKDDIVTALTNVLEDFPVYSRIVESTGQVIIQEEL
ncbi:hypothetical protein [Vibrio coralliilyticus]|uniref:hypothetical protein n=1 Tax=Vibrio coralliilyticus TaxID=190893 RepID=UPI000C16D918|nr:hypothetical protein [Vibrio coralliilyticus]